MFELHTTRRSGRRSNANGHFACTCYHPLFCFNQSGDLDRALLREGNVSSADDWRSVLQPIVARHSDLDIRRFFLGDAAFARPQPYEYLEAAVYLCAIRMPANNVLYERIDPLLPDGRGRRAQTTVPGDPGEDTTVATA
jgi:hypothetical protein